MRRKVNHIMGRSGCDREDRPQQKANAHEAVAHADQYVAVHLGGGMMNSTLLSSHQ